MSLGHNPERDALFDQVFAGLTTQDPVTYLECFLEKVGVSTDLEAYGLKGTQDFEAKAMKAATHPRGKNFMFNQQQRHYHHGAGGGKAAVVAGSQRKRI